MPLQDPIKRALKAIAASDEAKEHRELAMMTLRTAMAQAKHVDRNSLLKGAIPDDYHLALVLSAMDEHLEAPGSAHFEVVGFDKYEDLDPGWIGSLLHRIVAKRVDFPTHTQRHVTPVVQVTDKMQIAMAGDWGTGNSSSADIATQIAAIEANHTIHLGDVYYSGTDDEEHEKFLGKWPAGTSAAAPSFALNGNHEMYSGGGAYFGSVLGAPQFKAQQGLSYFALVNANWTILGADTAYSSDDYLYQHGDLGDDDSVQMMWLGETIRQARAQGKRLVLLTHHHGLDIDPERNRVTYEQHLWDQVRKLFGGGPDFWYWGHVHAGIAFEPVTVDGKQVRVRCVGHGGVPYAPFPDPQTLGDQGVKVKWAETGKAEDPAEMRRALNGFVTLSFDGPHLTEEFRDEKGNVRTTIVW